MLGRRVDVDHELDVVDVNATRRDIRRHEHPSLTGRKRSQIAIALHLREVAVQIHRRYTGIRQLLGELLGVVLRAHEQDAAAGSGCEALDEQALGLHRVDLEHVMGHGCHVRCRLVHGVQHLIVEVLLDETINAVVEGGAEQHALPVVRCLVHDAGDDRKETEVGHVVGLVEHGDFDRIQRDEALLHEVFEATGAGNDNVDTTLEGRNLALLGYAAEDRGDLNAVCRSERLHGRGDLGCELAGRSEDEAERPPRATLASGELAAETSDHRQGEGKGLAAASLAATEHIAPGEGVGQGVDLDRER